MPVVFVRQVLVDRAAGGLLASTFRLATSQGVDVGVALAADGSGGLRRYLVGVCLRRGGCCHESMNRRRFRFYALFSTSVPRLLAQLVVRCSLFLTLLRGLVIRVEPATKSLAFLRKQSSASSRAAAYLKIVLDYILPIEVI